MNAPIQSEYRFFFFWGGGLILPEPDHTTSELCLFYQSDLCFTKVFGGSEDQDKDLPTISKTYRIAVTNICKFIFITPAPPPPPPRYNTVSNVSTDYYVKMLMHLCMSHSLCQVGIQAFQYLHNLSQYCEVTGIVARFLKIWGEVQVQVFAERSH